MMIAEQLREVLDYDPLTGIFRWRMARQRIKVGDVAGRINSGGYRQVTIDQRRYLASRLAWLYVHGRWPKNQIDHKNGIRDDNRLKNLRDVTGSENQQNQRRAKRHNKTWCLGVSLHQGKFQARISVDGKQRYLGRFATPKEAYGVYLEAKRKFHAACMI